MRRALCAAALAALTGAASAQASVQPAQPIRSTGPAPTTPAYTGHAWTKDPIAGVPSPPQNPGMAPTPSSNVHNDTWMTDNYQSRSGPLGVKPTVFSASIGRTCITLTFTKQGQLLGSCTNLGDGPGLYLMDPKTLDTLAFMQLPYVPPPASISPALNTTGGAYFYLDSHDRAVIATADRRIMIVKVTQSGGQYGFQTVKTYDPSSCLVADERMPSALPDYQGNLWFVGRQNGTVGVVSTKTGACTSIHLNEEIENSFAVAKDGAYIVTDHANYRFTLVGGTPKVAWRTAYQNIGTMKVGQFDAGSGTTPTLINPAGGATPAYDAITDNADPMNVVVMRAKDGKTVCTVPVFGRGASDTENSLNSVGRSLFVENNYGYDLLKFNDVIAGYTPIGGDPSLVSTPGIARVDIAKDGHGCTKKWTNTDVRAASVVPKADSANGLLYTYENAKSTNGSDPWNWVALSLRTGKTAWKQRAGYGGPFNNHYAGIALGQAPHGGRPTLYVGGVQGVMALRDHSYAR